MKSRGNILLTSLPSLTLCFPHTSLIWDQIPWPGDEDDGHHLFLGRRRWRNSHSLFYSISFALIIIISTDLPFDFYEISVLSVPCISWLSSLFPLNPQKIILCDRNHVDARSISLQLLLYFLKSYVYPFDSSRLKICRVFEGSFIRFLSCVRLFHSLYILLYPFFSWLMFSYHHNFSHLSLSFRAISLFCGRWMKWTTCGAFAWERERMRKNRCFTCCGSRGNWREEDRGYNEKNKKVERSQEV